MKSLRRVSSRAVCSARFAAGYDTQRLVQLGFVSDEDRGDVVLLEESGDVDVFGEPEMGAALLGILNERRCGPHLRTNDNVSSSHGGPVTAD
jgi:hypothetical protein